jgi:hypothetical protein
MRHASILALTACVFATGCAHPFLKAGGDLGTAVGSGVTAVSSISNSEADTYRTYLFLEPYRAAFKITNASDLDSAYVGLACRPHSRALITESVALDDLNKYQAFLTANATDPKSPTLASLVAGLTSAGTEFKPTDFDNASVVLQTKRDADLQACFTDVRNTFVAPAAANIVTAAIALAAWPKIQSFFVTLLTEADKAKREQKIIDSLKDPNTVSTLDAALTALTSSSKTGTLAALVTSQKQIALWNAYSEFLWFKANPADPGKPGLYGPAMRAAINMATQFKIYDQLSAVSLPDVVSKMSTAIHKLESSASTGKAPDDSVLTEILSAIQFLSDASSNYNGAASAFSPAAKPKK